MKKATRILFAVLIIAAAALVTTACAGSDIDYANIETVTVDEASISDGFLLSEFDISKVLLNIKYFDTKDASGNTVTGETVQLPAAMSMVKAEDKAKLSVPGTKTVTLIYGKFEIQFSLTLTDDSVQKFRVVFLDEDGQILPVINGGVNGNSQYVAAGGRAVQPTLPTKVGYSFIGWRDRDTGLMTGFDNVSKDLTLVAVYAPDYYDVGFFTKINGEENEIDTVHVPRNANAYDYAPEIPIVVGYSNGRWENIDAMKNVNAEGLKFYAIYDADQVRIGFNYKRQSAVSETYTTAYDVGSEILNPPPAETEGFKFVEWQANGKKAEFPYPVVAEMVFTAVYIDINVGNAGLAYRPTAGGYEVSGFDGREDVVVIPENIVVQGQVYAVTDIAEGIFRNYDVREFVVSDTNEHFITEDGILFNKSKTELIAYPKARTQDTYTLLSSVAEIGPYAFYDAENLTEVVLSDNVTVIGAYAFAECINLTHFSVPKGVSGIGEYAFAVTEGSSELTAVVFANAPALTSIGDGAFAGLDKLGSMALPSTLTSLGSGVFAGCKALAAVTAYNNPNFTVSGGMLFSADMRTLYLYPAVYSGRANPHVEIDSSCERIVSGAFDHARISGITINSSVTLDDDAINCPGLVNFIVLANDMTVTVRSFGSAAPLNIYVRTGASALYSELDTIFPGRVKYFNEEDWAASRDYLYNYIYETYKYIENVAGSPTQREGVRILGSRSTDSSLIIPDTLNNFPVTEIADNAFSGNNFIEEIYLPAELNRIGSRAFYGMSKLRYVSFNEVLREVGDMAFADCSRFATVYFTDGLSGISEFGVNVFAGTPYLETSSEEFLILGDVLIKFNGFSTRVVIPASVGYIASDAFSGRGEIVSLSIEGKNLTTIDYRAFQFCTGLVELDLPESVVRIEREAFYGCDKLFVVNYGVTADDQRMSIASDAYPDDSISEVYIDSELFELTYFIDVSDSFRARGIAFTEPHKVDNTARIRFIGWYNEINYLTQARFPMRLTENKTVYARWESVDYSSDGLVYRLTDEGYYAVERYEGSDSYVVVPAQYRSRYVREIDADAFRGKNNVISLELPSGRNFDGSVYSELERIGEGAFDGTAWYDDAIGDFIVIDDFLIKYKGKSSVVYIPDGITKIAEGAFRGNLYVEKVVFPKGIIRLADNIFNGCANLSEIVLPDTLIDIGYGVFAGCTALTDINFSDCGSLNGVGYDSFDGTEWLDSYIDNCVMINDILYRYQGKNASSLHIYNGVRIIGERAFYGDASLRYVYIPQSVVSIGESAFESSAVTEVNLYAGGSNLTGILARAFRNCGNLTTLDLSLAKSLAYIGKEAFEGCTSLENIHIPAEVSELGEAAFRASGLKTVVFASGSKLAAIEAYTFASCTSLFSVNFSGASGLTEIGDYAFYSCSSLRDFSNVRGAIERLGDYSFYNCTGLINFSVDETALREIGNLALENVGYVSGDNKTMVVLGNILIKYNGFDTVVRIPANITTVYNGAFKGFTRITEVVFAEGSALVNINSEAFFGCTNLSVINFPDTVEYVGEDVMTGTAWYESKLRDGEEFIVIANTLIKYNGSELKQVVLPDIVEVINGGAFDGCGVYDIVIGSGVTTIEDGAFDGIDKSAYADWTITINRDVPPVIRETELLGAAKILMPDAAVMDGYRLDEGWNIQYSLMEVAAGYTVTFITEEGKALPVESAEAYAIYEETEVQTLTSGDRTYIFVGWYTDPDYRYPVTYPFMVTADTVLYAKCIDNEEGSNPAEYIIENGDTISVYTGESDNKIVVISFKSGSPLLYIRDGWISDPVNGTHIKNGDEYVPDTSSSPNKWRKVGAFEGHDELTEVYFAIGTQISVIGKNAFKDCKNLTKIVLPSSVTTIEEGAFSGCTSLREVVFASDCENVRIESGAFENCTSLRSLSLPAGVAYLGDGAFRGCTALTDILMESAIAVVLDEDSKPFELVEGMRIRIPFNAYNSYSASWPEYEQYLEEMPEEE